MKAFIVGASGQVGQALVEALKNQNWAWQGTGFQHAGGLEPLDIAETGRLRAAVAASGSQVVFFPAGWTWVDGCEADPGRATLLNALAPEAAAAEARRLGAGFVFYSTEYVFDGAAGPYDEQAKPAPLSAYGASKLEGEARVLKANTGALILRTTVVYGPEPQGKNFVYQLKRALEAGQEFKVPSDQVSNPTFNYDLARASAELVRFGARGIYNVAGSDRISRLEFANLACGVFGLEAAKIKPVATAGLNQKAARPLNAGLAGRKLRAELGWAPRGAREGLQATKALLLQSV